jgi:DNA polymerase III epsilon subunit-like protein
MKDASFCSFSFAKAQPMDKSFSSLRYKGDKILSMKALEKIIKDRRVLVFLDLEGTQMSHEMIEIGAYTVLLNENLTVKKILPPYTTYVQAHHPIGSIVIKLTGITQRTLDEKGLPFPLVLNQFKAYVGKYWGRCLFVTFGNHDLRIVNQSVLNNDDSDAEIAHVINKCDFDFSLFLQQYIQDPNSNPLSLTNYLKVFKVPFEGTAHDALADAYNLIDLYQAFLANPETVAAEYKKTLSHVHHMASPINKIVLSLNNNETVTPEDWNRAIKDALK